LSITPFALGSVAERAQLGRLVQMAKKSRRLAGKSRLGDDGSLTSLGNPYRRVRVGLVKAVPDEVVSKPDKGNRNHD
jgi:hypothetical protein